MYINYILMIMYYLLIILNQIGCEKNDKKKKIKIININVNVTLNSLF